MNALQESCLGTMRRDRDSFILLQHLHTLTQSDRSVILNVFRIGADLGYSEPETALLVEHLSAAGCVYIGLGGVDVSISAAGVKCIEQAWRRRSVRLSRQDLQGITS